MKIPFSFPVWTCAERFVTKKLINVICLISELIACAFLAGDVRPGK